MSFDPNSRGQPHIRLPTASISFLLLDAATIVRGESGQSPNPINDQTSSAASKQKRTNKMSRCSTFDFGNYPPWHEMSNGLSIAATFPPKRQITEGQFP